VLAKGVGTLPGFFYLRRMIRVSDWRNLFLGQQPRLLFGAYTLLALLVSFQRLWVTAHLTPEELQRSRTVYENYVIFKNAFPHLLAGLNPYTAFPAEQWDLYKYSPAFALCMAPFAALPEALGLPLWNLLNALLPLAALWYLPVFTVRQKAFIGWFILPEMVISLQNSQSNGITLACLLWVWAALEHDRSWMAGWWTSAGAFIKVFGILAAPLGLLYPVRLPAYAGATLWWSALLLVCPMLVLSSAQTLQVYQWWQELLLNDHAVSEGLSVQGWLRAWFGWEAPKLGVLAFGALVFGFSVLALRISGRWREPVLRSLAWSALLLWVVIFNHKAESPTFVIALAGVACWYSCRKGARWEQWLLWIVFIFASLSPTDLFPRYVREHLVQPYVLKAVPCIVLWGHISYRLFWESWNKNY
jgi:hypothetical protein